MKIPKVRPDLFLAHRIARLAGYVWQDRCSGVMPLDGTKRYAREMLGYVKSFLALRECADKDCRSLFVAVHGKLYCSKRCSDKAQAQWKKNWHAQQRAKRKP